MRRTQKCREHGGRTNTPGKPPSPKISLFLRILTNFPSRCACDVPSHNYTWSFEPKTDWSGVYATSGEIYTYFNDFAKKYNLGQYIKTQHLVSGAYWNHQIGGYDVVTKDLANGKKINAHCDILINASGILNNWRWPAIPGLNKYKGKLLHTAAWDDTVSLEGKHVGLIGNG